MNYKRFEDLPVWNTAIDLAVEIYALTDIYSISEDEEASEIRSNALRFPSPTTLPKALSVAPTTSCSPSFTSPAAPPVRFVRCSVSLNGSRRFERSTMRLRCSRREPRVAPDS